MALTLAWTRPTLLAAALLSGLTLAPLVHAEAPPVKTQVPGYYRHMVGDMEVTALYDGQIMLDAKLLKNASPDELRQLLARMFRQNPTATAVNAFLVNNGGRLVLVDTGAAGAFGPTLGQVLNNLKAAGYDPAQVDAVLLTHLHGDHVSGLLTAAGEPAFPKATVHVSKAEADHWLSAENLAKAPEAGRRFFEMAQKATAPYARSGRLKPFEGAAEILPGIKAVPAHGHTPGHTAYQLSSRGAGLLIWGDLVHNAAVQFARPKVTIEFDTDPKQAYKTRVEMFKWAAKDALLVAGMHLPFPGLGHVRADRRGEYTWVPIDFAPLPTQP